MMMNATLKCVLLDACIIIEAYKIEIWDKLIERVEISVASSVVQKEALFYKEGSIPKPIKLNDLIGISMEKLLIKAGLQKQLDKQFTENYFKEILELGRQNLITGQGLRK